jgi:hypothetical protein
MKRRGVKIQERDRASLPPWGGPLATADDIKRYQRVSTARKLAWLDEMRHLLFSTMTAEDRERWQTMREKGY